ncbi:MAG: response regulator [Polyangiaceae bacterium]
MKRVLVVDDSEDGAYYLQALFRAQGWEVEVARNGADALERARRAPPDLVVSDLLMPVMDGYTLLKQWKLDATLQAAPFVVYTATYTDPEDEQLARRLGADEYIVKPVEPTELLARVASVKPAAAPTTASAQSSDLELDHTGVVVKKLEKKMAELNETTQMLKREEAALRMLDRAIRAVAEGIVVGDAREPGRPIVYVSPGFSTLTGYSQAEIVGKGLAVLAGPGTDMEARRELERGVEAGESCAVELVHYRKDGTQYWCHVTVSPILDGDGVRTHYVCVLSDVSERRLLEAQLRQAQKMEAVGRLSAGIAHDFNNLLSVILGYSSMLLGELAPGGRAHDDVQEIHNAGERAKELTRQLLAFSRQQVLELRPIDLNQLVLDMKKLLERLLGAGVELSLEVHERVGKISADYGQIQQIVMNLAVNAHDAMPAGGVLTIQTRAVERTAHEGGGPAGLPTGRYVMLRIADTGVGMDAATRERIFEPFFTTKAPGKGTGLGLSTVFGIVKQCAGYVFVESDVGRGTVFELFFPELEPTTAPGPRTREAPSATLRGGETILLVEDQAPVRDVTRVILERHGYRVLAAESGEEALAIGPEVELDLVITDVVMPRMNGRELAERLAVLRPKTPVVFTSGNIEDAFSKWKRSDLFRHYLQKPITPEVLLKKVRQVLDEQGTSTA